MRKPMRRLVCLFLLGQLVGVWPFAQQERAGAEALNGIEVARRMYGANPSSDSVATLRMTVHRGEQQLVRALKVFIKTYAGEERRLFQFLEPASVRDTAYLVWSYENRGREDDIWVFIPAESMVRRVSGGGKKGAFMRSDLAVEDLEKRYPEDDRHRVLGSEVRGGHDCYILEMLPQDPRNTSYARRVLYVRKDIWLPVETVFFDQQGDPVKTAWYEGFDRVQDIWTITRMRVAGARKETHTVVTYEDIRFNTGLADSIFDKNNLKR